MCVCVCVILLSGVLLQSPIIDHFDPTGAVVRTKGQRSLFETIFILTLQNKLDPTNRTDPPHPRRSQSELPYFGQQGAVEHKHKKKKETAAEEEPAPLLSAGSTGQKTPHSTAFKVPGRQSSSPPTRREPLNNGVGAGGVPTRSP